MIGNLKNHRLCPHVSHGILLTILLLFAMFGKSWSQDITGVEYFFDTDPGYNAGTQVPLSPPDSNLSNFNFNIDISGLEDGFHKLFVRATNEDGVWSFTNNRAFYKNTLSTPFYDLSKVEYFLNTDLGPGNGTNVPFTPGPVIPLLDFTIDISGLPDGFHQLYVRTKNQFGQWSFANQRPFLKQVISLPDPEVAAAEYFLDADPGIGQGTQIPVNPNGYDVTLDFVVDLSSVPEGFHQLYARVKDSEGYWSLTSMRSFLKQAVPAGSYPLSAIEYFIDDDPGFGQATQIPINPNESNVTMDFVVDLTSLSDGFHNLMVRSEDAAGLWSLASKRSFVKQSIVLESLQLTRIEYFLDSDPGLGMGTQIPNTPSNDVTVVNHIIDITSLDEGLHKLFVRTENELGVWSLTNVWPFYKQGYTASLPNITAAEYFLNNDPGIGLGISIPVPGNSSDEELSFIADLTGLNPGFNKLFVRTKDADGRWSMNNIHTFYKTPLTLTLPDLVYAEYFIDDDPGMGQGISIPIQNPGPNLTDIVFEIDETQLIMGNHLLFVRTLDENGRWSLTLLDQFCRTPKPNFATNPVWFGNPTTFTDLSEFTDEFTQYFWDVDGNGTTDYTSNTGFNHEYAAPGTYNARLILISQEGCSDTIMKPVYVFTCSPPVALMAVNITANSATLQWTPANMEPMWDVEYGQTGFIQGTGTLIQNIPGYALNISGLASATGYEFYVRSSCYLESWSSWAGPATFTTLEGEPCENPTDGGSIAASQTICAGTYPDSFTSIEPATDFIGDLQYQWQISDDNVSFFNIGGANSESYTHMSIITNTMWFKRLAKVSCEPNWNGAAESNVLQIDVEPSGQYRSQASGDWNNPATWEFFNGSQWVDAIDYPGENPGSCPNTLVTILNAHTVTVTTNISFGNIVVNGGGTLEVINNVVLTLPATTNLTVYGTLVMHPTAVVSGAGNFTLASGCTFYVGSVHGININGLLGNIQVSGSIVYAAGVHYIYNCGANQLTGDGIAQYIPASITINNPGFTVTLSVSITISGSFSIVQGTFDANNFDITLGGSWICTGIFIYGTSTVYFNSIGNVYVDGGNFYNVVFGGSGSITATGSLIFYGNVSITGYFYAGSYNYTVYGGWIVTGTFAYGTSTIYFACIDDVDIGGGSFYNVVFSGSGTITATGSFTIYGNFTITGYFIAGSYTHYVYGSWVNNGTFIYGNSTIYFACVGDVYINTSNFYNIIFGGSGTVTATGPLNFYGNVTIENHFDAGTFTHVVYGNWTVTGIFVYGTSSIDFQGSGNALIGSSSFYNVCFCGSGTNIATGSLTFYGNVDINGHFNAGSFTHYVYGNWTLTGIFIHGTSTIDFHGSGNALIGSSNFYNVIFCGTGTNTATGSLTIYGYVNITWHFNAGSFIHYVYGNWTLTGVFIHGTSTIDFQGSGNALIGSSNFYNVCFCGSGTNTATSSLTFYGNVDIHGHFNAGSFTHYVYGNWTLTGIFIHGTSTIDFHGSGNALIGSSNFYNVIFCGTGTNTATGSLTIYGFLNITWHFDAGSFTHYVYGNWTLTGVFIHGTSTIDFHGSGNALIGSSNFYNVCFCGSGTNTATGSLTFYGNVNIHGHFNAGSFTHYVYGNWTLSGVFIHGTSTIDFHGSGNALIGSSNFYNVIFCGTGTNTATGSLSIYGYVHITWHFNAGPFVHYVYGNWMNNAVFIAGTSTIHFVGSIVQTISGSVQPVFYGFTVNCTGGIVIETNITINYMLTLTLGIVTTGNYSIWLIPACTITGGSTTSYVNGRLIWGFVSIGSKYYPVGTAGIYRPVMFNCLSLVGTSYVEVEAFEGIIPGTIPIDAEPFAGCYWDVSQIGGTDFTCSLTLNDPQFVPVNLVWILQSDGVNVQAFNCTAPNYTNIVPFTLPGFFTLAELICLEPVVECPDDMFVLLAASAFELTSAEPQGGTYSGEGINSGPMGGYFFYPSNAGEGDHVITYSYTDQQTTCTNICTFIITVSEWPLNISLENMNLGNRVDTCFAALQVITIAGNGTTFTLQSGGIAEFAAGQRIEVKDGTHILPGAYALFRIETSDGYCSNPKTILTVSDEENQVAEYDNIKSTIAFKVFPNPTSGRFMLELMNAEESSNLLLEVYGIMGERITTQFLFGENQHELDISNMPNGIYFIRTVQGDKVGFEKLIKQ
ncbi:MAG: T9SS type A sorting domain-containing protein [Bacteroidales bacterium]|nr:T9SS type A sorting domain-containing protein [Bacteroidales bacterium]